MKLSNSLKVSKVKLDNVGPYIQWVSHFTRSIRDFIFLAAWSKSTNIPKQKTKSPAPSTGATWKKSLINMINTAKTSTKFSQINSWLKVKRKKSNWKNLSKDKILRVLKVKVCRLWFKREWIWMEIAKVVVNIDVIIYPNLIKIYYKI